MQQKMTIILVLVAQELLTNNILDRHQVPGRKDECDPSLRLHGPEHSS